MPIRDLLADEFFDYFDVFRLIARLVDGNRHPDGVGHLQPAAAARVDQQELLPVGKLQRRDLGDA